MTIQATYHSTGLTIDEVFESANNSEMFKVQLRSDNCVHAMVYPKRYSGVKVQILNGSANVWVQDLAQLHEIEELLNRTFGDGSNPKPFKEPNIQFHRGELKKILETPLGAISVFFYYYGPEIRRALPDLFEMIDNWRQPWRPSENSCEKFDIVQQNDS